MQVAERLRAIIAETPAPFNAGEGIALTVSIGLALAESGDRSIEQTIDRADRALYDAKRAGRNRVVLGCCLAGACLSV
jgi:diguanylate cyclase (GGDEF)-like protein